MSTKTALGLLGLLSCTNPSQRQAETADFSATERSASQTVTIPADYSVRVREAESKKNFYGQPAMIGCSADGFDRYLVHFPMEETRGKEIASATLYLDALSGTCNSSYDSTKCGLEMTIEAKPIGSSWDAFTVKWNTQPKNTGAIAGQKNFSVPYQETATVNLNVTEYLQRVAGKGQDNGFVLSVANDTETTRREQGLLHENPAIVCGRGIQRDVRVENPQLEITYK